MPEINPSTPFFASIHVADTFMAHTMKTGWADGCESVSLRNQDQSLSFSASLLPLHLFLCTFLIIMYWSGQKGEIYCNSCVQNLVYNLSAYRKYVFQEPIACQLLAVFTEGMAVAKTTFAWDMSPWEHDDIVVYTRHETSLLLYVFFVKVINVLIATFGSPIVLGKISLRNRI